MVHINRKDFFIKIFFAAIIIAIMGFGFDKFELENRAFATIIAIDESDEGLLVSLLIADTKKFAQPTAEEAEYKKTQSAKNLNTAINELDKSLPNKLYFGHLKAIVLSNEVLNNHDLLISILAELLTHREINIKTLILKPEDGTKAEKILEIKPTEHKLLGIQLSTLYSSINSLDLEELWLYANEHSCIKRFQVLIPTIPSTDNTKIR